VPLANWQGRIIEETMIDDGAERKLTLAVEGALRSREKINWSISLLAWSDDIIPFSVKIAWL
jgi:hypothetical protein